MPAMRVVRQPRPEEVAEAVGLGVGVWEALREGVLEAEAPALTEAVGLGVGLALGQVHLRTAWLLESAMKTSPAGPTATPLGV